ncbi:diacylglycerol/lipid kinase family protein [Agrococcus jejuensis]|uniref:diacylglycerol/lipid kinase family protein n=1 Tax=Agrococcus jejuensis TaxID=399736 RepID=UPI0011AA9BD7|nr:diacylglycerol kinase family protein [Agrococcus jejuensis]
MRAAVVYNPVKADRRALEKAIEGAQPDDWDEAVWFETDADDDGRKAVEAAIAEGVDVALVAGGDGTVRMAAELLAGTDIALAVLPSGTGNLLARNLGIDLTFLRASVRTAYDGKDRRIDVGWAEFEREDGAKAKHAFVVIAGFGLDAAMVQNTDAELKKKVGWLAYVDAIVKSVQRIQRVRMRYRVDGGQQRTVGLNTLMVGNCGALTGNVVLLPDARIDDGRLDVAILRPKDAFGWLQVVKYVTVNSALLTRVLRRKRLIGPQKAVPTLGYGQCAEFKARLDEPMPVQIDGDPYGEAIAMRFSIQPGALTVKAPQRVSLARPTS